MAIIALWWSESLSSSITPIHGTHFGGFHRWRIMAFNRMGYQHPSLFVQKLVKYGGKVTSKKRMLQALEGGKPDMVPIAPYFWGAEYTWKIAEVEIWELLYGSNRRLRRVIRKGRRLPFT